MRHALRLLSSLVIVSATAFAEPFGTVDSSYNAAPIPGGETFCSPAIQVTGDMGLVQAYVRLTGTSIVEGVARRRKDGSLDTAWAANGLSEWLSPGFSMSPRQVFRTAAGGYLIVGTYAVRLNADGTRDTSYGNAGLSAGFGGVSLDVRSAAMQPNGGLVALTLTQVAQGQYQYRFTRLTPEGSIDRTFGVDGFINVPLDSSRAVPFAWGVQADGQVQLATYPIVAGGTVELHRYPNDFTFAENVEGRLVPRDVAASWMDPAARVDPQGRLVLSAACYAGDCSALTVARFTADGRVDPTFGDAGRHRVTVSVGNDPVRGTYMPRALFLEVGTVTVLVGHLHTIGHSTQDSSLRAFRLPDQGGPVPLGPALGSFSASVSTQLDGRFVVNGSEQFSCSARRYESDKSRGDQHLVEYVYRDRYFITAEGLESAMLDNDPATEKLRRTGRTLGSWSPAAELPGASRACRFVGDPAAGPRGHFYTLEGAECDLVLADDRALPRGQRAWRFEGMAFEATPPVNNCPQNLQPVYRIYNNAATRGGDSNHRFTTDPAVIAEMQRQGWSLEGVAFCSPLPQS